MITQSSSCEGNFWFPGSCCYRTDHISKDGCSLLAPRLRQRASRCSQLPTSSRKEIGVCTRATRGHSQRTHWHFGLLGSVSNSTTGLLLGCFVPAPWQHWLFFFKACWDLWEALQKLQWLGWGHHLIYLYKIGMYLSPLGNCSILSLMHVAIPQKSNYQTSQQLKEQGGEDVSFFAMADRKVKETFKYVIPLYW